MNPAVVHLRCACGRAHVVDATPDDGPAWVEPSTVERIVGVRRRDFIDACRSGAVVGARRLGRRWLAPAAAVTAWLASLPTVDATPESAADAAGRQALEACGLRVIGGTGGR